MEPVYMNMHSYPHQSGQMHYRPRCYPGMEARPPMGYEGWPWGGSYGYAPPGVCHGCSNHTYMPPHFAYPHVPPHYYPGNYPYFPVPYMPPPPYNVMEHPRYEYEKNSPVKNHCCGCHNHPLHQKEQGSVRIEEEEPEKENRENDSLVPSQSKNLPYPIVWFPPDYKEFGKVKNKEGGKDAPGDVKEHGNGSLWDGWLPLDLKNVLSSKQRGDGEENSRQDNERRNMQFPLFWMPYKPDEGRENHTAVENVDAKPSLESEKASGGGNTGDKSVARVKEIPVKEDDQHVAKESTRILEKEGDTSTKDRTGTGEKNIDNVESVSTKEGPKRKSSSPPKSTKLPPVCLRVDPLPRKKSANTKSRSPSPPGDKQKLEVKSTEAVKDRPLENEEQHKEGMNKKTISVVDGNTSPEESMNVPVETPGKLPSNSQDDVSTKQAEGKPEEGMAQKHNETGPVLKEQPEDVVSAGGEKEESLGAKETQTDAAKKCRERELSEEEAAAIIQSAYRGFDIRRRWAPLEKLKEIAKVRGQLADVKRLIQEMELSSDMKSRPQQKNIIAETIMSLLLRLDVIQGLHPSIREVRKSTVRELVSLQEQLDSIMNENSEKPPGQEPVMKHDQEDASSKIEDVMFSENSNKINPVDLQNQTDGVLNPEGAEFPEANPIDEAANSEKTETKGAERSIDEEVEPAQGPTIEDEDDNSGVKLENNESSIAKEDQEAIIPGQSSENSSLQDESAREADPAATHDHDSLTGELTELPQGLVDDICGADELHRPAVESDLTIGDSSKQLEEAVTVLPIAQESQYGTTDEENHQTMEIHESSDLQVNGADLETKETGKGASLDNCNLDYKSGTEEEVDIKTEDAIFEPDESRDKQPENVIAHTIEPSEASDEREFPMPGACIGNMPTNDEPHESSGVADSVPQPQNMEEIGLISEHSNTCDAESAAAEISCAGNDTCSAEQNNTDINHSEGASETGLSSKEGDACNVEHQEFTEKQQLAVEENAAVESNRKLMEENERLREMMEKLIKSGQEQLTAISSLSGRVKDLEKRLSRKKKLKFRGPRSRCITKLDGCGAESTLGLAM